MADRDPAAHRGRPPGRGDRASSSGPTRSRRRSSRPWRPSGSPTWCEEGSDSSPARRSETRSCSCRGAARSDRRRRAPRPRRPGTSSPEPGGHPILRRAAEPHGGAGSRCTALASLADDLAGSRRREARSPSWSPSSTAAPPSSTPPPSQGVTLASACMPRRASSGTPSSSSARRTASSPSLSPRESKPLEEERRLLYVGLTRARQQLFLSWSSTRTSGGRPTRRVSRFLGPAEDILGSGARTAAPTTARRRAAAKVATVLHCRGCGAELTTAAQRKTGRCDDCPPSYDEALFERLREWRLGRREGRLGPGLRRLHRCNADRDCRARAGR